MAGALLDRQSILERMRGTPPLVEGLLDAETQLQPNGIDLTAREAARLTSPGAAGFSNEARRLSEREPVPFDEAGRAHLSPGAYLITMNEVVHLPLDLAAMGRTRSSLLRCGVALHTAVWDAGYSGRSESLMVVYNPQGFVLERNARVLQLVFFRLEREASEGYRGRYLRENL